MNIEIKSGDRFAISLGNDGTSGADTLLYGIDSNDLGEDEMMREVVEWL